MNAISNIEAMTASQWADYRAKDRAIDAREIRKALQVDGLTPTVVAAVERALAAHEAAEVLHETFGRLDANSIKTDGVQARCDRAEGRWSRANDYFLKIAQKVLDVPTLPGRETEAKFEAFLRLIWVESTNPRHRKRFSAERAVGALHKDDCMFVAKAALAALRAVPTPREEAVQIVGAPMAEHIAGYKAALDAEAGADMTPEYEARYSASMEAERALLLAPSRTLAELNAKAKAFTNPDGTVDDVGDSAQAARVIQALARDIDRLASAASAPAIASASDAELLAFDAQRARLWEEATEQTTDEAADAVRDQSDEFEDLIRRAACATPVAAYLKLDVAKRDMENGFIVLGGPDAANLIGQVMAYLRGVPVPLCPSGLGGALFEVHQELNTIIPQLDSEDQRGGGPLWHRKEDLQRIASRSKAVTSTEAALQAAMIIAIADVACEDNAPDNNRRDRELLHGLATGVLHFLTGATSQHDPALRYYSWPIFEERLAQAERSEVKGAVEAPAHRMAAE